MRSSIAAALICPLLFGCAATRSGLSVPSGPQLSRILADSANGAEAFCPDFGKAKHLVTGSEVDMAVRKAIEIYTHGSGFVAEVRLISPNRAVAAVVKNPGANLGEENFCCRLKRRNGHWVVIQLEMTTIA